MNVYEAWGKIHIWRNVPLTFPCWLAYAYEVAAFAVGFLTDGFTVWELRELGYYISKLTESVYLVWRGGLLLIVMKYMEELEMALLSVRVGGAQAG